MTIRVQWLLLAVPLVCLQCVVVVFPDHTHLLLVNYICQEDDTFIFLLIKIVTLGNNVGSDLDS